MDEDDVNEVENQINTTKKNISVQLDRILESIKKAKCIHDIENFVRYIRTSIEKIYKANACITNKDSPKKKDLHILDINDGIFRIKSDVPIIKRKLDACKELMMTTFITRSVDLIHENSNKLFLMIKERIAYSDEKKFTDGISAYIEVINRLTDGIMEKINELRKVSD